MKLRVLAKPTLTLIKEQKVLNYGDVFDCDEFGIDVERASEILKATFQGKPVAELVIEDQDLKNNESKDNQDKNQGLENNESKGKSNNKRKGGK